MSASLWWLVAALGAAAIVWWANRQNKNRVPPGQSQPALPDRAPPIMKLAPGDVFSLRAVGADMDDMDVTVRRRHLYIEDGYHWLEYECDSGARTLWLSVEDDDELILTLTLKKVGLEELGLTKDSLAELTDTGSKNLDFEDRQYRFEDRGEAVFYPDSDRAAGERLTYWSFAGTQGEYNLTVEQWSDGTYACHISQIIPQSRITLYSGTGEA